MSQIEHKSRLSKEQKQYILDQWRLGVFPTAASLAGALNGPLRRSIGRSVSSRHVQNIIAGEPDYMGRNWRKGGAGKKYVWNPWTGGHLDASSSEELDYLLDLEVTLRSHISRGIYEHEAKWAKLLRHRLKGLSGPIQWVFISCCANREVSAHESGRDEVDVSDVNTFLAIRPWEPKPISAIWDFATSDRWTLYFDATVDFPQLRRPANDGPTSTQINKTNRFLPLCAFRQFEDVPANYAHRVSLMSEVVLFQSGVQEFVALCRSANPPGWVDDYLDIWKSAASHLVPKFKSPREEKR